MFMVLGNLEAVLAFRFSRLLRSVELSAAEIVTPALDGPGC